MAGPGPTCTWEQDHNVQDGTSCLMESRLPGSVERRSPWVWERGKALFEAYERAQVLAPEAILRQTGYVLGEVLKGLLPGLLEMLVVLAATTAIGAVAGGVVGFFFGGAGAAPGAVIGGEVGLDVGLAALTWLGVAFLAKAMLAGFGNLWSQLSMGVRHAWEAPEYPEREYPLRIEEAARELADAAGILMLLLLQAVVAWILKRAAMGATQSAARTLAAARTAGTDVAADSAVAELVGKLRASKLGSGFADWVEKNWTKLKEDPRLRFRPQPSTVGGPSAELESPLETESDVPKPPARNPARLSESFAKRARPAEVRTAERLTQQPEFDGRTFDAPPPPDPGYDWTDDKGHTYDAMGDGTKSKYFNLQQFTKSIDHHLTKGNDFTVIDMTGYTPEQVSAVAKYVDGLSPSSQAQIRRIGF